MGINWNKTKMKVGTGLHHDQFKEGSMYMKNGVFFSWSGHDHVVYILYFDVYLKSWNGIWCVEDNVGFSWHNEL
jgi:hypothetical protein